MCVSLLHEWDRSLTRAHFFFFFFFFFDSSGTMGFSSHAAVPERGWALLWRGGARINTELTNTGAHSALTFSFSPLKNKQGWGGVSSQRPSPTTDFCSWHSYFMKASQRLSKNVLIFIFLLVLVTYIFIENRYKCFKKEKSSHQSDLSLMCLKWLMTVTWSEANILHLVINQVKIYKLKKKKDKKRNLFQKHAFISVEISGLTYHQCFWNQLRNL